MLYPPPLRSCHARPPSARRKRRTAQQSAWCCSVSRRVLYQKWLGRGGAGRNAPAPKASGWLSAKREPRRGRKGPRCSVSSRVTLSPPALRTTGLVYPGSLNPIAGCAQDHSHGESHPPSSLAPLPRFAAWGNSGRRRATTHRFPFARLCGMQSIWQFSSLVSPPFDQAVTWSASISLKS